LKIAKLAYSSGPFQKLSAWIQGSQGKKCISQINWLAGEVERTGATQGDVKRTTLDIG
jgi:hypothetical protein